MRTMKTTIHGNCFASNVAPPPSRQGNMFFSNGMCFHILKYLWDRIAKANVIYIAIVVFSLFAINVYGVRTINVDAPNSQYVGVEGLIDAIDEAIEDSTHTTVHVVLHGQYYELDEAISIHMSLSHIQTLHIRSAYGAESCMIKALPPGPHGGPYWGRGFKITAGLFDYNKKVIFSDIHFWYDGTSNTIIMHRGLLCSLEIRDCVFDTFGSACFIYKEVVGDDNRVAAVKVHNNTFVRHFDPENCQHRPDNMIKLQSVGKINFELSNNDFQNAYFPLGIAAARLNGTVSNNSFIAPKIIFPNPPDPYSLPDMADSLNCITIEGSCDNNYSQDTSIFISENYLENVNITVGVIANATVSNNTFVHNQNDCERPAPLLSTVNHNHFTWDNSRITYNHINVKQNTFWNNMLSVSEAFAIRMYQHPHRLAFRNQMFIDITQNSFMHTTYGVGIEYDSSGASYYVDLNSCLFFDNSHPLQSVVNIGYPSSSFDVSYCLFDDQIPTGDPNINIDLDSCIDSNPLITIDQQNYTYSQIWANDIKSLLINNGYRGENNELTDPDGTPPDIGSVYYPHHHWDYEFNYLQFGNTPPARRIFWRSFPVLDDRTCADNVWHNELGYLFREHMAPDNLQLETVSWSYDRDYGEMRLSGGDWLYRNYQATQPKGFKVSFIGGTDPISPIVVDGFKADPATTPVKLYGGPNHDFENWIGYFVPYTQGAGDAFGRPLPGNPRETYIDYIFSIGTQHWSTSRRERRYGSPWIVDPNRYTVSEGDMLSITLLPDAPEEMYWACLGTATPRVREMPEQFSYVEKLDYIPIFIQFDPDNLPDEVGMIVAGECKGAAVVDSSLIEVNFYPSDSAKGDDEIEIFFYYGSKGTKKAPTQMVYNPETLLFEAGSLKASQIGDYGYISFYHEAGSSLVPLVTELKQNYPNPFKGNTTISWVMAKDEPVKIEIYNLRGQKVTTLYDGWGKKGRQAVSWDAKDAKGQSVASGVYFYRLSTPKESKVQKMMVIKN